ncbi:MAG: hypothetical protein GF349_02560 [Candidatus Magasanikbacteria bacterium]|nr:hypothetical protein [Candidatus Magasanikbacteria bacterium]
MITFSRLKKTSSLMIIVLFFVLSSTQVTYGAGKLGGEPCTERTECESRICIGDPDEVGECACRTGELGVDCVGSKTCEMLATGAYGQCKDLSTLQENQKRACRCEIYIAGTKNQSGEIESPSDMCSTKFVRSNAVNYDVNDESELPTNFFLFNEEQNDEFAYLNAKVAFNPYEKDRINSFSELQSLLTGSRYVNYISSPCYPVNSDAFLIGGPFYQYLGAQSREQLLNVAQDPSFLELAVNPGQCNQNLNEDGLEEYDIAYMSIDILRDALEGTRFEGSENELASFYLLKMQNCSIVNITFPETEDSQESTREETDEDEEDFSVFAEARSLDQLRGASAQTLIGRAIKAVLQVMGSIALIMFIYGGVMWMTARGNAQRVDKAINTLVWSALGVVVILASYAIVDFVFEAFR